MFFPKNAILAHSSDETNGVFFKKYDSYVGAPLEFYTGSLFFLF